MISDHPPGAAAARKGTTLPTRPRVDRSVALAAGISLMLGGFIGWLSGEMYAAVALGAVIVLAAALFTARRAGTEPLPFEAAPFLRFIDRADGILAVARRHRRKAGVVCVRVHGMKEAAARGGGRAIAELCDDVQVRIGTALRVSDDVTPMTRDTFVVVLAEVRDDGSVPVVVEKILEWIEVPFAAMGRQVDLRATAGAAILPDHGSSALELITAASKALHVAERSHASWALYSDGIDETDDEDVALASGLSRALDAGEFVLHYQPQVDLRDGRVRSVEVLLRWQHPQKGTLHPPEFLAVAEHTGVIRRIARYVLEEALLQCSRWLGDGIDLRVAVNLSGRNLLDPELPEVVATLLSRWNLDPGRLEIEISEGDLPAAGRSTFAVLEQLHRLGVRITIDDFGTGSADLALLRHVPVDQIKIDRSFVLAMDADEDYGTIVRSAIAIARSLGVEVAAEGVETERVWEGLIDLRCDAAQGYYISRPVPAETLFGERPPPGAA